MSQTFGQEEGETCWRNGCQAKIAVHAVENCSCHINPPCGSCTEAREYCPECDWHAKDDEDYKFVPTEYAGLAIRETVKPRPLDPRKIDYRITGHSNASQCCEGVYPDTATQADVEARVHGTFGGRFEYFNGGKFRYIAYTD